MQYAVETFSLTKIFNDWWGRSKVFAVEDLHLKIRRNEVFGLLGPNGSGKTTTIKMLLGLLHPTRGRAVVLGGDSTSPKISTRIGFCPEESYLYRFLSARETLDFYGKLFSLPAEVRRMRTESLLDMVGLRAVANRPVGTYSKGMARRIGLAQALINDPDLLILDEPTTGLDPIGTRQIKDLILKLAERGKTILLCSHLLADVEDVCDRIAILYGGKVRAEGKVDELLRRSTGKQINTGPIGDDTLAQIRRLIESEDVECEITSPMDRLEAFFIRTVAEAQQQDQPTSGAVSTTRLGDFLTRSDTTEAVLDRLVDASVDNVPDTTEPATEPVAPAASPPPKADQDFLKRLTQAAKPVETTPVAPVQPAEPTPPDEIDIHILDRLARGDEAPEPPQPRPEKNDA
ncbi:MAG TPA: ATP-binding cassette domain-containing protein [Phycisphaerales bacterium]|nr:ATP-binding cassette domain-containing protein [Phycisphaerales bacterium]